MSLDLENLKNSRDEVLKAEIGSLLFNLGKTHIGIGNWKDYYNGVTSVFGSYKEYYQQSHFEDELNQVNQDLKDFIFNTNISLNSETTKWVEYFKGDVSSSDIVKKVFFRGCENINSGIDKGSPKEQLKDKLWIANAFGSYKKELKQYYFDKRRCKFFKNFHNFLDANNYYTNPNWKDIREFLIKELKNWYSNLLSDSRFPVNDVTLFDQAYMSASMFKASIAGILLNTTQSQDYISNPQSIKWQILGIQYDKLSLAEKGLKPAHIIWYREQSQRVDNRVKNIIESEYALGNEIYRDETGIYFLVPESITTLNDIEEIKNHTLETFKEIFSDEVYPYIGFTKASRGTMNLTSLLENAKKNFLKADYSLKSPLQNTDNTIGICQICQNRLVKDKEKDDETLMCDICRERKKGRVNKWLKKQDEETIWITELADSNNRVALVSLKFELMEWLNGGLLSSTFIRNESYQNWLQNIKIFLKLFYSDIDILQIDLSQLGSRITPEQRKNLGRKNGLISGLNRDLKKLKDFLQKIKDNRLNSFNQQIGTGAYTDILLELISNNFLQDLESLYNKINELLNDNDMISILNSSNIDNLNNLKNELEEYRIEIFILVLTEDAYIGCKKWGENFDDYIQQIFFASIVGTNFEKEIKNSSLNTKIDWKNEKIKWNELEEQDIELLSKLLLQFLLRKNPSPARLRRVWESTEEFFDKVKKDILDSFIDIRTENSFKEKVPDFADLNIKDNQEYKQYFSIIDPTPISWQFIIPTQKVEEFIKKVQDLYYQNFKYVNGKLPLHIGIVIQKSKDPLYVGIKALRNIRRDIKKWSEIKTNNFVFFQNYLDEIDNKIGFSNIYEKKNNTDNFYSLYETENKEYDFMLLPSNKGIKKYNSNDSFIIYPNTIDFEYLDTNTRRNDIYYKKGKRIIDLKQNRPYSWEEFEKFKRFRDEFKDKSNQLQSLVSLIYSKMEDWKKDEESFKIFMESTFKQRNLQKGDFGMNDFSFDEVKKFLDMFEFWHTTLKEI